jgi:hypothetical protein
MLYIVSVLVIYMFVVDSKILQLLEGQGRLVKSMHYVAENQPVVNLIHYILLLSDKRFMV